MAESPETSYEQAEEIMGENFYGIKEIFNTFGFEFPKDLIPPIPYNPPEILYDWILQFKNRKERGILEGKYDWSNTLSSFGKLVSLGDADRGGVLVDGAGPDGRLGDLGVVSLR